MSAAASPRHIVIIGAARSGTKVLRDSLAVATGAGRVPYDISYVWRYGNETLPDDVIEASQVSDRSRRFIRRFVDRYASGNPPTVIEKTVGNAVRVHAVHAVLPDATIVHLIRDGIDVIESTRRQWSEPVDLAYLARKARHFPLRLVPTYGASFVRSAIRRRVARDRRVGTWGLRYPGIDADLAETDLLTVCARQWREAVTRARAALAEGSLPAIEVRYEAFVANPQAHLARIIEFAGLRTDAVRAAAAAAGVSAQHRGQGRARMSESELACIRREAGALLAELGYVQGATSIDPGPHPNED